MGNQPNPDPTHPANLICTLNTRFMLIPEHVTALNDLTDNYKPDIIALTETWIRGFTTPAELIDSTPRGYSLFSAPRSHTGNPSKPILAGGTAFLVNFLFYLELRCSSSLFIRIFIHNSKISQSSSDTVHVYRPPLHHHTLNRFLPFLTNSHRFFPRHSSRIHHYWRLQHP